MAAISARTRAPRRHWPLSEKRRIVELTLREGASLAAIAQEQDVHLNSLYHWQALYRVGKLGDKLKPPTVAAGPAAGASFVPVSVVPEVTRPQSATRADALGGRSTIVQLVLASGATLRIECAALDAALVCALVAELQR